MQSNRNVKSAQPSTTRTSGQSQSSDGSTQSQLKQSLRGMSYDEQMEALSPEALEKKAPSETKEGAEKNEDATGKDKPSKKWLFGGKKGKDKEKPTPKHDSSGFSDKEKKQIAKACVAALPMVTKALARIGKGHGHYRTWMDDSAKSDATDGAIDTRIDHVRSGLEKVKQCLENDEIKFKKYALNDGEEDETYAYVVRSEAENNIYLGGAFWSFWTWTRGKNSQAGTIIHELTHRLHGTKDHGYGTGNCKGFAKKEPEKATTNADNYEYFCETA
ncbi:MAG TPA: M35 family metallopeptidase [Myxococcota bacterium]|nr:M35 family metallopeptidase [Myxococcota bacterium]